MPQKYVKDDFVMWFTYLKCPKIEKFHFRFLFCFKPDHVLIFCNVPLSESDRKKHQYHMAKSSFTCFLGSFILLPIHCPYDTAIYLFRFTGQGWYLSYLFTAYTLHIRFICGRLISINWMHFIWDRTGPHMLHIWYSPKRMDVVKSDIKDSKMLIFSFWKGLNKSFCKWIKNLSFLRARS